MKLLGGEDAADLAALRLWKLAQDFWGNGKQMIPLELFEMIEAAPKLIEAKLVSIEDGLVYVRGAREFLTWLHDKRLAAAAGGKKSAESRKAKTGSAIPKNARNKPKKPAKHRSTTEADSSNTEPSDSYSDSGSKDLRGENANAGLSPDGPPPAPTRSGNEIVEEYYSAWRKKYHERAPLLPADHKKLKDLGKSLGFDSARRLVHGYFDIPNKWFATKKHDVQSLMSNLTEVQAFLVNGEWQTRFPGVPGGIRHGPCEKIIAEDDSRRGADMRGNPEAAARLKDLIAQTGNLGMRKTPA